MLSIGKKTLVAAVALVISLSVPAIGLAATTTDTAAAPVVAATAAPVTTQSTFTTQSVVQGWQISTYALNLPHKGYRFGANGPYYYDCSSWVRLVFSHFHIYLPRTAAEQSRYGRFVSKANLRPGDVVFFKNTYKIGVDHVGIYIGGGKFIHDWPRTGVIVSSLSSPYFVHHYWGAKRMQ